MNTLGREVGRRSVERLGTGLTRIVEETSALCRWTLTMLMLLNGAAIYLCIAARAEMAPEVFAQLVLIFFSGAMAALLAAFVGMGLSLPITGSIRRAITEWTEVSVSGVLSDGAQVAARRVRRAGAVWLAAMTAMVLASLILFIVGALTLGERFGLVSALTGSSPTVEAALPPADGLAAPDNAAQPPPEVGNMVAPPLAESPAPPASPVPPVAADKAQTAQKLDTRPAAQSPRAAAARSPPARPAATPARVAQRPPNARSPSPVPRPTAPALTPQVPTAPAQQSVPLPLDIPSLPVIVAPPSD